MGYCVMHDHKYNGAHCDKCEEMINERIEETTRVSLETKRLTEVINAEGHKADSDKPRFSLVPLAALGEVIKVLEFGAKKYAPDNWQKVPDARTRYYDAAMRHLTAWFGGERNDPESGIHHLAHAGCCVLFLLWFEVKS